MSVASRADKVVQQDAVSVRLMRDQGAIIIAKGNCSEGCMTIHSNSHIWGEAKNPLDNSRTTGGSSGGDAGMIAGGCSPLALATDFAGSIRIPSFFNGLVGFLPSPERHSTQGISCYTKYDSVHTKIFRPCIGPISRCVDDIVEAMKVLDSSKARKYDKLVPDQPFDQELYDHILNKKSLRIGVIKNISDIVTLEKESLNAYEESKEAFIKGGHEIVEFEMVDLFKFVMNGVHILNNEAFPLILDEMMDKGDPLNVNIQVFLFMFNVLPKFIKKVLGTLAGLFLPRVVSELLKNLHPANTGTLSAMTKYRFTKIQEFTDILTSKDLDGVLIPGYHSVPFEFSEKANHDLPPLQIYLMNVLHCPVGAVPVPQRGENKLPVGVQIASTQWR
eukprot:CAMPEP_0205799818 /NCGR_PEP_ID=MMETSP0205-20121125/1236_1 /ASSEMBLY_ACC=CAM_ASM_000278 /TAXON_ID=36767 /ORGANISM="Euplotes focardii, Strain TN1" /LENGTH=388 /DNA_ID=CAMNT_0053061805 /DNA_START=353 /DNA_END=1516 /DNA_ORIENTATION=-